jgi:tetratricopeptide (TPR) repeat protein
MGKAKLSRQFFAAVLVAASVATALGQAPAGPLTEARELVDSGRLSKAESSLRAYLADHPDSADAHFLLGYVLFREQKATESLAEFTAGAKVRRPKADELETVASDYVLLGDFADADKWFSEVTVENPGDAHAWYLLGRTKYNEGRYDEAVSSFERALSLRPKYVDAQNNLGLSLRELNKLDEAKVAFQTAIDWQGNAPVDAQPYLNLGALLADQEDLNKAIPLLEKAVALSPENPKVHEQLGAAYAAQNDLPRAQSELQRAIALAPDTSALHFKLGEIYRKQKMRELAQHEFEICARLNSTHSSSTTPNPFQPASPLPK